MTMNCNASQVARVAGAETGRDLRLDAMPVVKTS
jgi:hypothetical protein